MVVTARFAQLGLRQALRTADEVDERDVADRDLAFLRLAEPQIEQAVGEAVEAADDALAAAEQGGDAVVRGCLGGEAQRCDERGRERDPRRQAEAPDET